jgi:hypothetical protein
MKQQLSEYIAKQQNKEKQTVKYAKKRPFKKEWYPEYNGKQCPYLRINVISVAKNILDLILRIPVS